MKTIALTTAFGLLASSVLADGPAPDDLSEYLWTHRPILVFAESERDPRFVQQMAYLEEDKAALEERNVVVITDVGSESALREEYRPRGFSLVLVGKDGQVKLRKPRPWTVREISRVIDKMPMRQQEMGRR